MAESSDGSRSPAPVSVVIAVRDGGPYLGPAIDSVLTQTRPPREVVVVDDGSTDGTPDVIASYGSRIQAIRQAPAGVSTALNRGIAATSCEYVAILDADDVWLPEKLAIQLDVFAGDADADAVFGLVTQFLSEDADPALVGEVAIPAEPQPGLVKTAMLVRREALDRVGPFDESLPTTDFMDWYARALEHGIVTRMPPAVVARRRIHGANTGIRNRDVQREESLDTIKAALDRRRGG